MAKKYGDGDTTESVIGPSVRVEGDLTSEGNLQIEGQVAGKVNTSRDLFVGDSAKIQASISAQNATIAGVVEGDIKVANTLVLLETGKVLGNIFCRSLGVREGAFFSGQVNMQQNGQNNVKVESIEANEVEEEE
ncbi:MAG: hypothetical protein A3J48_00180 [Candidatus Doudnabacteria bacterium RIFCSPHIGHO2_02_FULL_46_11]|uniref:Cell shape determination protein CcmA n=1 Tax=Candidatus Doudnabacteria bacterium RIFCSPHIGHO2_02_FULL_46_11 TaxID=1817832 RepID=A0A1F5P6G0_9BACT|nr:MAG: hypothetical protein A3J48_00180 [Candidatus Doudnabacteria bacterium RIFCSPHIGHO2_02_FULL_46_11]